MQTNNQKVDIGHMDVKDIASGIKKSSKRIGWKGKVILGFFIYWFAQALIPDFLRSSGFNKIIWFAWLFATIIAFVLLGLERLRNDAKNFIVEVNKESKK